MKKHTHIYIAGPMSGLPKHNFPAFMEAAKKMRAKGYKIINPAELETVKPLCTTWEDCLRRDLRYILTKCYAIATIPGWKKSRGAKLETFVAKQLDMDVYPIEYWLDRR